MDIFINPGNVYTFSANVNVGLRSMQRLFLLNDRKIVKRNTRQEKTEVELQVVKMNLKRMTACHIKCKNMESQFSMNLISLTCCASLIR